MIKSKGQKKAIRERSSTFTQVDRGIALAERWLNYSGTVILSGLMAMTVIQVVSRHLLHHPMRGYIDYMEMMLAALVFFCLAYCQQQKGHIRIELLMNRLFKGERSYQILESFHLSISLVAFALIAFYSTEWTIRAYVVNDISETVYVPLWPARMTVAIGSILLCFRYFLQLVQSLKRSRSGTRDTKLGVIRDI